jgi:putative phosphoesterase
MRVAVVSDIHGNLPALEAVLADIHGEDVDAIVAPGDTISGPWPVETFDLLVEVGARLVVGNADVEVIRRSDRYGQLAIWSADRLGAERLAQAAEWPLTLDLEVDGLGRVLVCHSTPLSPDPIYTRVTPDAAVLDALGPVDADVLSSGHTHMQYDRRLSNGLRIVNPGSVGMPYEGRRGAFWALLGDGVEMRSSEYDVEATVAAIRESGAPVDERLLQLLLEPPDPETTTAFFEEARAA